MSPAKRRKEKKGALEAAPRTPEIDKLLEQDAGPETSPYTSPTRQLTFRGGQVCSIPSDLLSKSKILHASDEVWGWGLQLENVPIEAGHVLVHYIHTGTYQTLKYAPEESSESEEQTSPFEASLYVYAVARAYDLPELAEMAKERVLTFAASFPPMTLLFVASDARKVLDLDDPWLQRLIKSHLEQAFKDAGQVDENALLACFGSLGKFQKMMVRCMIQNFSSAAAVSSAIDAETLLPEHELQLAEPEPRSEDIHAELQPPSEPEPITEQESAWNFEPELAVAPEPEPIIEQEPEPEPEPNVMNPNANDKAGGVPLATDQSPGTGPEQEPAFGVGSERTADTDWNTIVTEAPPPPDQPVEPLIDGSVNLWGEWGHTSKKKKKKKAQKVAALACVDRAAHVTGDGWENCQDCLEYVNQLSSAYQRRAG